MAKYTQILGASYGIKITLIDDAVFESSDNNSLDKSNTNVDNNEIFDSTWIIDELNITSTSY